MARPFNSEQIIEEHISEATLRVYHVGYELNEFRYEALASVISRVIPEFALGFHEGKNIPYTQIVEKLREAAKSIYDTDKYSRRGEFGELILHLLLRDFCGSVPLLSKVFFKDTPNIPVHGFDGVHIVDDGTTKKLWLGESKLYTDGKDGVEKLAEDVEAHLKADYLRKEFSFISRKIPQDFPEREEWIKAIHANRTLDEILDGICIPLVCTYSSGSVKDYQRVCDEYYQALEEECRALKTHFDSKVIKTDVDIVLMLVPIKDKSTLVTMLDTKLKNMQNI